MRKKPFPADDPRHGSTAGYQAHRSRREIACEACRNAQRDYQRSVRADPEKWRIEKASLRAKNRAIWRLINMHRDEFERLYAAELTAEKIRTPQEAS